MQRRRLDRRNARRRAEVLEAIRAGRDTILRDWEREARERARDRGAEHPALLDCLAVLVDYLTTVVATGDGGAAEASSRDESTAPRVPWPDPLDGPGAVLRELALVRECIARHVAPTEQLRALDRALDRLVVDAAEHYWAESARAREAAEARAAHLEAVLESLPEGLVIGDRHRIERSNEAAAEIAGWQAARPETEERGPSELVARMHARDADSGQPIPEEELPFTRALRGETARRDVVIAREDTGEDVVVRMSAAPIRTDGRVVGAVSLTADITSDRRAEEVARERERFIAILGHDLRNPVSAILLGARMLLTEDLPEGARSRIAGRISRSAERMNRMIGDLLDFARGQLGAGIPITPGPADLHAIAKDVLDELRTALPDLVVTLTSAGDLTGTWDRERLAQLLGNLVANAVQHRVPGTPIRVELVGEPDVVRVEVKNDVAEPVSSEGLERLFDPFRTGARPAKTGASAGIGLGLYIVREIVHAHGGSVEARCDDAEFSLVARLPRCAPRTSR